MCEKSTGDVKAGLRPFDRPCYFTFHVRLCDFFNACRVVRKSEADF